MMPVFRELYNGLKYDFELNTCIMWLMYEYRKVHLVFIPINVNSSSMGKKQVVANNVGLSSGVSSVAADAA